MGEKTSEHELCFLGDFIKRPADNKVNRAHRERETGGGRPGKVDECS